MPNAFWPLEAYSRPLDADHGCDAVLGHGSATLNALAALVWQRSGVVIGPDRFDLLETKLHSLLARTGLPNLDALVDRVAHPAAADLAVAVVEAITPHETSFFRDAHPFTHLVQIGLAHLDGARPPDEPIRIWSAGSSSGQEAYSIAMAANESLGGRTVRILGTDIAPEHIGRAQTGTYTQHEVQRGLSAKRLLQHFDALEVGWRMRADLRAICQFGMGNLLHDPAPLGLFDIIFCRNVVSYFDEPTKRLVLTALAGQLMPDGWIYLGAAETAARLCPALKQAEPGQPIYQLAQ